jgi:branched-chain amino acid transport system substrate-binding protein
VSGDGALDPGFIDKSGAADGEGALITCPCKLATADAGGALGAFATKYKSVVGKDAGTYSSEGYDAANILIKGVEAGNTDRAKLLAYVESLTPYVGLSKTIEFEPNGNVKGGDVFVYEVKGGKLTELGTTTALAK